MNVRHTFGVNTDGHNFCLNLEEETLTEIARNEHSVRNEATTHTAGGQISTNVGTCSMK